MSAEQFFACIGEIDDRFIEEAENYRKSAGQSVPLRRNPASKSTTQGGGIKKSFHALPWISAAACLALLAIGGIRFIQLNKGISFFTGSNNGAAGGSDGNRQVTSSASSAYLAQENEACDEGGTDGLEAANADASEAPGVGAAPSDGGSAARQDGAAGGAYTDGIPEEKNSSPALLQYPSKCVRTNGYTDREFPYTVVIRSEDELTEYVSSNAATFDFANSSDTSESFCEAVEAYDEGYFESGALVFAVLEEGSCSVQYQVDGITAENEILVERLTPDVQDDGMAEWHIILEIPADSPTIQSEQPFTVAFEEKSTE